MGYSPLLRGSTRLSPSSSRGLDRLVHYGEPNDPEWLGGSEYMQRWVHSAVSLMGEGDDEATMLFYQLMNWRGRGAMSRRTRGYLGRGRASPEVLLVVLLQHGHVAEVVKCVPVWTYYY